MRKGVVLFLMFFLSVVSFSQFGNLHDNMNGDREKLERIPCSETLYADNEVKIYTKGSKRIILANGIPEHEVGEFLRGGQKVDILEQDYVYKLPLNPKKEKFTHILSGSQFGTGKPSVVLGIAINGVKINPASMDAFRNPKTKEMNFFWAKDALGLSPMQENDCNSGSVNESGEYEYRGIPLELINNSGGSMNLLGWAADGFPMYYKFGYQEPMNSSSPLVELMPSYQLKTGNRRGDGVSAPDGVFDGTYVRDYEFVENKGDLDKANGRYGVTPEFPEGTYYYVITDAYPSLPRYLAGSVNQQFEIKMVIPEKGMRPATSAEGGRTSGGGQGRPGANGGADIMSELDANNDGKISKSEAKGPLATDFSKLDANGDGFLSKDEIPERPQQQKRPQQRR